MRVAIMQPYFLPYIGYYQLIFSVDRFVLLNNIQYTKRSWVNRNRILVNEKDRLFTIPIKHEKRSFHINQRYLSSNSEAECKNILKQIKHSYSKAKNFKNIFPLLKNIFSPSDLTKPINLFEFILNSISITCKLLKIKTRITFASDIDINHNLKSEKKILEICKTLGAKTYINLSGGKDLYGHNNFRKHNISLRFLETNAIKYCQASSKFIPSLSIIDVLMNNDLMKIQSFLNEFKLSTKKY